MKLSLKAGTTSKSVGVFIQNNSVTTGAGLTGLAYNTASLTAYYVQPGSSAAAITLATLAAANSAWSSGGFKEIDSTNMPGVYRLDIPDAVLTGATSVIIMLKGATNMAPCVLEIELTAWNNQDSVRGGMTAMPNAAAGANGGLPLSVDSSGRVDVLKINGTSQTARDIGASVLLSSGTGTGQVKLSSGYVAPNWGDIGNPTTTVNLSGTTVKTATDIATQISGLNNITAASVWAVATRELTSGANIQLPANGLANVIAWTVNITGSLSGAVGSVTGNLGGNVLGSVASVVGLTPAYLDVAVSTRLAAASYTAPDNAGIATIQGVTDNLPNGGLLTSIAQAADLAVAQGDLDILTGVDGATLATLQPNYAPAKVSDIPTADENADAYLDRADAIETGLTPRQSMRLQSSALAGKVSGGGTTTNTFRNAVADSKDRIVATVDSDGNRTAITTDVT